MWNDDQGGGSTSDMPLGDVLHTHQNVLDSSSGGAMLERGITAGRSMRAAYTVL